MTNVYEATRLLDEDDVNVLHRWALDRILMAKPEDVSGLLKALLSNMLDDKKWIRARMAALASEAEHVARIGETMTRAGLRSYTDKEGRIFVAAPSEGKSHE